MIIIKNDEIQRLGLKEAEVSAFPKSPFSLKEFKVGVISLERAEGGAPCYVPGTVKAEDKIDLSVKANRAAVAKKGQLQYAPVYDSDQGMLAAIGLGGEVGESFEAEIYQAEPWKAPNGNTYPVKKIKRVE